MAQKYKHEIIKSDIIASHSLTKAPSTPDFHVHNNYEIYVFVQGNVNYFVEQCCYKLQTGDILIFNNQEIHAVVNLANDLYERYVIHFDQHMIQQFSTIQTDLLACFTNRPIGLYNLAHFNKEEFDESITLIKDLIFHLNNKSYGSDVLVNSYLTHILVIINKLYKKNSSKPYTTLPTKVNPIMRYIDEHISEELSLECIAHALSMDKYYLSHVFKKETGSTLFQYIVVKRVTLAKLLLAKDHSVTEACELSGFNDYSNFIRTFKKITGISPGKYKKRP